MKLYSRQLHSLEELKREKHVLKYTAKHTEDWLSFNNMKHDTDAGQAAGAGMLGTLISALGSKSAFSTLLAIAPPLLTMFSKKDHGKGKKKHNPIERLAKEILLGYIKWKAVQIVYRGIMKIIKPHNKEHKEKEHA